MLKRFFFNEGNILKAIVLNALVLFSLAFPLSSIYPTTFGVLQILDLLFSLFFIVEAIVKIKALGSKAYFQDGWNRFDFSIVLASLPSILALFIPLPNTSILQLLRLFRLVKLMKFLQFIPHLNQLLSGLKRASKASVFVILALIGFNFILSVFSCHLFGSVAPDRFGDPMRSAYTLFQMFTVEGWNEIPNEVVEGGKMGNWKAGITRFYFVLVVLAGGIFGMSIANAIFVDEMTLDNNQELEKKIDHLQNQIQDLNTLLTEKLK